MEIFNENSDKHIRCLHNTNIKYFNNIMINIMTLIRQEMHQPNDHLLTEQFLHHNCSTVGVGTQTYQFKQKSYSWRHFLSCFQVLFNSIQVVFFCCQVIYYPFITFCLYLVCYFYFYFTFYIILSKVMSWHNFNIFFSLKIFILYIA